MMSGGEFNDCQSTYALLIQYHILIPQNVQKADRSQNQSSHLRGAGILQLSKKPVDVFL